MPDRSTESEYLTREDVERIAALAHLELTAEETARFAGQLAAILQYADEIRGLDTTGVAPTSHVLARPTTARRDETAPSLDRGEALANAPDGSVEAGLFRVPRVIG
jgi:aspartyl-tRNA(Asn)/glutamyl-tRNA(Gln) amidotransferase subunit C